MDVVRRCLGCSATYPADEHACPKCGSHAADTEAAALVQADPEPKRKPSRRRKT
jgi:rRNA maturation endonuclease Nob1